MSPSDPETHYLQPTAHAPNSHLPILIYRSVLPSPASEDSTTAFLTAHSWRKGGTWGHLAYRHFHPNVHECYGVFQGRSRLMLGRGTGDGDAEDGEGGLKVDVKVGDVIVLPAGTGHACLESSKGEDEEGEYRYIGVYPENGPKWKTELGKNPIDHEKFREQIDAVAAPLQDPVFGEGGPMIALWSIAQS